LLKKKLYVFESEKYLKKNVHNFLISTVLNKQSQNLTVERFIVDDKNNNNILDRFKNEPINPFVPEVRDNWNVFIYNLNLYFLDLCDKMFSVNSMDCYGNEKMTHTHVYWSSLPEPVSNALSSDNTKRGKILTKFIYQYFQDTINAIDPLVASRFGLNLHKKYNNMPCIFIGSNEEVELPFFYEKGFDCIRIGKPEDYEGKSQYKKILSNAKELKEFINHKQTEAIEDEDNE
jgi:hypothetical protein